MRNKAYLIILFAVYFVLQVCLNILAASKIPEVFVQTGHSQKADYLAVDENGKYLVTAESVGVQKIWEIATGKEIKTLNPGKIVNNLYFNSDKTFILHYKDSAEIYNINGEKLETINLPKGGFISKNKKFIYHDEGYPRGLRFYDIKDGSEIKLRERIDDDKDSLMLCLGFDYYGYFYDSVRDNKENIGYTSYVIYDKNLRVKKRGFLKGIFYSVGYFKVDPDLRYLYENRYFGKDPVIIKHNLDGGATINSAPTNGGKDFSLLPDGRIILHRYEVKGELYDSNSTSNTKVQIIEFLENGTYKEKNLSLEQIPSIVITNQAKVIVSHENSDIKMYDMVSGREILKFGVKPVVFGRGSSYISAKKLLNIEQNFHDNKSSYNFNLWNLGTASLEKFNIANTTSDVFKTKLKDSLYETWMLSNPADFYSLISKNFFVKDYYNTDFFKRAITSFPVLLHSSNREVSTSYGANSDCILLENPVSKTEIAKLYSFSDGEWIVITPEGYFNASPGGAKHLNVRVGNNVHGIDQFYSKFYRPELVQLALAGTEVPKGETFGDILAKKPAPSIRIMSPQPGTVDKDTITLTIKVADNGGGIGNINIYLNGAQVANETRSLIVKDKGPANEKILTFTIPLIQGQNEIRAIAFNKENSMESYPALISIISNAVLKKPYLYALVIGINTYKNKSIALTYAVSDAVAFGKTLQDSASPLFEKTNIRVLTTPEATTKEAIIKALEELRLKIKPNDLFVFYNASHGIVDVVGEEEQYFLLTSNILLLSSRHIGKDAISQKELAKLIGSIPAQKKVVILDTCNAGKGGKEIQIALLQQTRGLTDSTAVKLLQRAIGSAVFSASSDTQFALEGYKGHGLFTYVLIEGLLGKADIKKDGYITVLGLADYVEEQVVKLSEEVFKHQQTPTIQTGANFPIGKVK